MVVLTVCEKVALWADVKAAYSVVLWVVDLVFAKAVLTVDQMAVVTADLKADSTDSNSTSSCLHRKSANRYTCRSSPPLQGP